MQCTHMGLEKIGQIYMWSIIMFYQVVSIDHVYWFVLLSILIVCNKNKCLNICL